MNPHQTPRKVGEDTWKKGVAVSLLCGYVFSPLPLFYLAVVYLVLIMRERASALCELRATTACLTFRLTLSCCYPVLVFWCPITQALKHAVRFMRFLLSGWFFASPIFCIRRFCSYNYDFFAFNLGLFECLGVRQRGTSFPHWIFDMPNSGGYKL